MMEASGFFAELRRRRVLRVAVAYLAVSWLLVEVVSTVAPMLRLPDWTPTLVLVLLGVGFPIAMILTWAFDVTPEGVKRAPASPGAVAATGRAAVIGAVVVLALAGGGWWASRSAADAPGGARASSIAVLPFDNLSPDEENAYFAAGLHDALLSQLAGIGGLKVTSRTSVLQYDGARGNLKDIAAELGVATILEGSVQRQGERVRVTVQLIDARTDEHLWAEVYDRDVADLFTVQTELATGIAGELRTQLTPAELARIEARPTADAEAYDLYLQARAIEVGRTMDYAVSLRALELYDRAIERDSTFALAHARRAVNELGIYFLGYDSSPERRDRACASAERAVALAPELPEGHLAVGYCHYHGRRQYDLALREFEIARRGLPNDAVVYASIGYIQRRRGDWDGAVASLERAVELDPRNPDLLTNLALTFAILRRYEDAERVLRRRSAAGGEDPLSAAARGIVYLSLGEPDSIVTAAERVSPAADPGAATLWNAAQGHILAGRPAEGLRVVESAGPEVLQGALVYIPKPMAYAVALEAMGDSARARAQYDSARMLLEAAVLTRPADPRIRSSLAQVYAALGEKGEAIREGRRAIELLPISVDAVYGPVFEVELARVYARVGEPDSAIARVERLLAIPSFVSAAALRLDSGWDPIREHPRFRALVEGTR